MNNFEDLKYFLDELTTPPENIENIIENNKWIFRCKGYGTPELEMKFLHQIFVYIQKSHPEFDSFSWIQTNAYNDEYHHFELHDITVNDTQDIDSDISFFFNNFAENKTSSRISFMSVEYPDPDEAEFAKMNNLKLQNGELTAENWDDFYYYKANKYKNLEIPCLKMLCVLLLLELNFSMYYFLYIFGNSTQVKFSKTGVTVTKMNDNEVEGSPLGIGMEFLDNN